MSRASALIKRRSGKIQNSQVNSIEVSKAMIVRVDAGSVGQKLSISVFHLVTRLFDDVMLMLGERDIER